MLVAHIECETKQSVKNARRMVRKYGEEMCRNAFVSHQQGNGASTVGIEFGVRTNTADALINAGRVLKYLDNSESTR